MTLNCVYPKWVHVSRSFFKAITTTPHMIRCLVSIKGSEARNRHTAQNDSELNSILMASKHRGTLDRTVKFCLCDVKYSKRNKE